MAHKQVKYLVYEMSIDAAQILQRMINKPGTKKCFADGRARENGKLGGPQTGRKAERLNFRTCNSFNLEVNVLQQHKDKLYVPLLSAKMKNMKH